MALQDLTPQLRTRLSRVERAVGWFVMLATVLLVFGFGYYVYQTAESKGWFKTKAKYFTFVESADGLNVDDPVTLMGFTAGRITDIKPMPPMNFHDNVYVEFELQEPNIGYMWTEGSWAKVAASGLLNKRTLEVTKGTGGHAIYINFPVREMALADAGNFSDPKWRLAEDVYQPGTTQMIARAFRPLTNLNALAAIGKTQVCILDLGTRKKAITAEWNEQENRYDIYAKTNQPYWLRAEESPALSEELQAMVGQVQAALPNILNLTNKLTEVLSNSAALTSNLNAVALSARPAVSNLTLLTAQINQPGALGEWLLPTNVNRKLDSVLGGADATLASANTNLALLAGQLSRSLDNLANITSNLNSQVQANTNILSRISKTIVDADDFVQGLKHHWLLRSAFKHEFTNAPPARPPPAQLRSPKNQGQERR